MRCTIALNAMDIVDKDEMVLKPVGDRAENSTLLGRKSLLMGMAASMGFVFANAAQPASAAGTLKLIAASQPAYAPKWTPNTAYVRGQQVISPNNDVVSANVAQTSSSAYTTDIAKWTLSSTYLTLAVAGSTYAPALVGGKAPVRKDELVLNVRDYGALGNSTHDDTNMIQAAINAAAINGGVVFFPAGKYVLTSSLILKRNVGLAGSGETATLLYQSNASTHGVTGVDLAYWSIRDLQIVGPGTGAGADGINFTVSGYGPGPDGGGTGNATYFGNMANVKIAGFSRDGVSIQTPIVSTFDCIFPTGNGRHGFYIYGAPGELDGTSCSFRACYAGTNVGAGYYLKQMVYTTLDACAADNNGINYQVADCGGIVAHACGCEGGIDNHTILAGYTGLLWSISGSKVTLNAPFMIGSIGTSMHLTSNSVATITDLWDYGPGAGATTSIVVDSGCKVTLLNPTTTGAMSLAAGTTVILPDPVVPFAPNLQSANYTLGLTDAGRVVMMDVATPNTVSIPLNVTVPFPVGATISIVMIGAGTTAVATDGTLISAGSKVHLNGTYAVAHLTKLGTDLWILEGDVI